MPLVSSGATNPQVPSPPGQSVNGVEEAAS